MCVIRRFNLIFQTGFKTNTVYFDSNFISTLISIIQKFIFHLGLISNIVINESGKKKKFLEIY